MKSLKHSIEYRLLHELIKAKSSIGFLRPTDCNCNSTFAIYCHRCGVDQQLSSMEALIKEAKNEYPHLK